MTTKDYKWELRKGSRKEICPACGKRRFVPYVSASDGKTLAGPKYGRCDREQSCGYFCYPSGDDLPDVPKTAEAVVPDVPIYISDMVCTEFRFPTAFYKFLSDLLGVQSALRTIDRYKISEYRGRVCFVQRDINGIIRAVKMIKYKEYGHRDKEEMPPVMWGHKCKGLAKYVNGNTLQQCFFGEHLLKDCNKVVAIVESEKTASCMAEIMPSAVWIACGGSQMLKNERMHKVLEGRRVVMVPDNGQYYNWQRTAQKYGYEISDIMEGEVSPFEGADILDIFTEYNKNKNNENHGIQCHK